MDYEAKNILVFGVNDRDQDTTRSWIDREGLPFPVLMDPDRTIAMAYGMSRAGDEKYLANPSDGRRPVVIIDENGIVQKLLPDLATVEEQVQTMTDLD